MLLARFLGTRNWPKSVSCVKHASKLIACCFSDNKETLIFPWKHVLGHETVNDVQLPAALFRDTSFRNFDFAPIDEVKEGATAAFETAVESLFHIPHESDSLRSFELLAERKLAEFVEVQKDSALIEHDLHYELQEIISSKIIDAELVIGTSRKSITSAGCCISGNGVTFVRCLPNPQQRTSEHTADGNSEPATISAEITRPLTASDFTSLDLKSTDNDFCTLRYTVEFLCKEIFYAKHKGTGNIVQGSITPAEVSHKFVLENTIPFVLVPGTKGLKPAPGHVDDWIIVDIDNWLEGNRFWEHYENVTKRIQKEMNEKKANNTFRKIANVVMDYYPSIIVAGVLFAVVKPYL